jgi:energy-coupling factor transporter ATP-binding protein EcfA2
VAFGYNQFHVILGAQGCGKSTLAARLLRAWPPARVYVYDPWDDPIFADYHKCDEHNPPPSHHIALLVDECHQLLKRNGDFKVDWLYRAVWGGRHGEMARIFVSIRPQLLNTTITSQARTIWLGRMTGSRDVDYAVRNWGDRCEAARGLPSGQFLRIDI